MVIDFTEITDDHAFENFCMHLLQKMGLHIPVPPAVGADGGRDIICEEASQFSPGGYRWLVSCKHFAGSKKSVGVNADFAKPHKLVEHRCHGFMFMFSTAFTEDFRTSLQKICFEMRSGFKIFNCYEIEEKLLSSPHYFPLIRQYFPRSHDRLASLASSACCHYLSPQDALYAVYTQTGAYGGTSYQAFGTCCVDGYTEYLEKERIAYSIVKIRNDTNY